MTSDTRVWRKLQSDGCVQEPDSFAALSSWYSESRRILRIQVFQTLKSVLLCKGVRHRTAGLVAGLALSGSTGLLTGSAMRHFSFGFRIDGVCSVDAVSRSSPK
eukprot:UN2582